jgi:peptidoglycan-N-acetylglucosamine deacetylase
MALPLKFSVPHCSHHSTATGIGLRPAPYVCTERKFGHGVIETMRPARADFRVIRVNRIHLALAVLAALLLLLLPAGKILPVNSLFAQQVRHGVRMLGRDFSGLAESDARKVLEELARVHRSAPIDAAEYRRPDGTVFVTPQLNGYVLDIDASWYRLVTAPEFAEVVPALRSIPASNSLDDFPTTAIDRANPHRKAVALLINVDWGEKELPPMLAILKKHGVRATFFLSGRFADKFPQLTAQVSRDGHEVASHGYDLSTGPRHLASIGKLKSDIARSVDAIERATGRKVLYFAPHMSEVSSEILATAHQLKLRTILHSVDSIDWRETSTSELILSRVSKAKAGDFILLHPKPNTVAVLEKIIGSMREKGLSLMILSDILSPDPQLGSGSVH